jgi:hypothetical protein
MNLSELKMSWRALLVVAGVIISVIAAGYLFFVLGTVIFRRQNGNQTAQQLDTLYSPPPLQDEPLKEPLLVIQPVIEDCLFPYFSACVEKIARNFINTNRKYEVYAEEDVKYLLSFHQQGSLSGYSEIATPAQLEKYFPEYLASDEKKVEPIPAALILQRVALKENVNPRVLMTLMEVLYKGHGVVLTGETHPQYSYFADRSTFFTQLEQTATELNLAHAQYGLPGKTFPKTFTFQDKTYQVDKNINAETMAIVEYLSKHLKNRGDFEKALLPKVKEGELPNGNFVRYYQLLFGVNPVTNTGV